jgi:hypothetical protein
MVSNLTAMVLMVFATSIALAVIWGTYGAPLLNKARGSFLFSDRLPALLGDAQPSDLHFQSSAGDLRVVNLCLRKPV